MDVDIYKLKRRINRFRDLVEKDEEKYQGKEHTYTFHGGFSSGYNLGKLSALEDILWEISGCYETGYKD